MMRVAKSTVKNAGKGVFATRDYKRNEFLGIYKGVTMTPKEFMRYNDAEYAWELLDEDDDVIAYVDARDPKRSNWTRFVNCPSKKSQENVKPVQKGFEMHYYAKRDIKKGEELFVWYGPEYAKQLLGISKL